MDLKRAWKEGAEASMSGRRKYWRWYRTLLEWRIYHHLQIRCQCLIFPS